MWQTHASLQSRRPMSAVDNWKSWLHIAIFLTFLNSDSVAALCCSTALLRAIFWCNPSMCVTVVSATAISYVNMTKKKWAKNHIQAISFCACKHTDDACPASTFSVVAWVLTRCACSSWRCLVSTSASVVAFSSISRFSKAADVWLHNFVLEPIKSHKTRFAR